MLLGVAVTRFILAVVVLLALTRAAAHLPENFIDLSDEVQAVILEYAFFSEKATKVWGKEFEEASVHHLVKYLDDYHTKVSINFASGKIRVESEGSKTPIQSLQHAIMATLLTPADPSAVDLYTAADMGLTGKPFLANLVLDHTNQPITSQWRAQQYAQYLTKTKLHQRQARYWVDIPMVRSFKKRNAEQYYPLVRQASQRYRVDDALILAIMETESSFNPFAVSHAGAFGLMQVMRQTAGKDVFEKIYRRDDYPSRNYLLDPAKNIDAGTAYLSILRDQYLKGIRHPLSLEYCIIASYNGGSGNLLRTFHKDRSKALALINRLTPSEVYQSIVEDHPSNESRNYLKKVTTFKRNYQNG